MTIGNYRNAEILWNYMQFRQRVKSADALIVLGSRDDRVAVCAANMTQSHAFPSVLFTGGISHIQDSLATPWGEFAEAEWFARIFKDHGGQGNIYIEPEALNTGQNATLSYALLKQQDSAPSSILIVTKPYMERRALATFQAQWPDPGCVMRVTSPHSKTFKNYCNDDQPEELVLNIMVGDMQRIIEYPKLGLQMAQIVPPDALAAYEGLIAAGYTKHIIKI